MVSCVRPACWDPRPLRREQAQVTSRQDPVAEQPRPRPPFSSCRSHRTCVLPRGFLSPNLFSYRGKHNLSSAGLGRHANQPNSARFCEFSSYAKPPEINQSSLSRGRLEGHRREKVGEQGMGPQPTPGLLEAARWRHAQGLGPRVQPAGGRGAGSRGKRLGCSFPCAGVKSGEA